MAGNVLGGYLFERCCFLYLFALLYVLIALVILSNDVVKNWDLVYHYNGNIFRFCHDINFFHTFSISHYIQHLF